LEHWALYRGGAKPSRIMAIWQMHRPWAPPTVAPEAGQRILSHLVSHPDLLTTLAALFYYLLGAAFSFALPLRCAGPRYRCDHDSPRWDGHTRCNGQLKRPVLGSSASIMGRSSTGPPYGLRSFAVPRSYAAIIAAPLLGKRKKGWGFAAMLRPFIALSPTPMP
jgi:hypothetical protein